MFYNIGPWFQLDRKHSSKAMYFGATTLNMMTFHIMAFSTKTFSITSLSITANEK